MVPQTSSFTNLQITVSRLLKTGWNIPVAKILWNSVAVVMMWLCTYHAASACGYINQFILVSSADASVFTRLSASDNPFSEQEEEDEEEVIEFGGVS